MKKENLDEPYSVRTISGMYVNVFDPNPDTLLIEDIAHALSQQCRFGGHLPEFYSVAQHSYNCFLYASDADKFEALMHDASEAYLLDMPRPIKVELPEYKKVEDNLLKVLATKFGFTYPKSDAVSKIDLFMLEREWNRLMLKREGLIYEPIRCMGFSEAKNQFLEAFYSCKPK